MPKSSRRLSIEGRGAAMVHGGATIFGRWRSARGWGDRLRHPLVPYLRRKLPRDQRFILAQRLLDKAFAIEDGLVAASVDRDRTPEHLLAADVALTGLRRVLYLCHELE